MNYYAGNDKSPYHLSVGAVVINENNEVACHYFDRHNDLTDFYIVMRESLEMGETIEQALDRGLMEEFGMKAPIIDFMGSLIATIPWENRNTEKTTLYFLCQYDNHDESLRKVGDPESNSQIVWKPIDFLVPKMREQVVRLKYASLDESEILLRVKKYLGLKHSV